MQWRTIKRDSGRFSNCPEGTCENSPAIHRWAMDSHKPSPVGTAEIFTHVMPVSRPLRDYAGCNDLLPAMNRWATIKRP